MTTTSARGSRTLIHQGKDRTIGSVRTWNVRAYSGERPRVRFLDPDRGWAKREIFVSAFGGEDLTGLFERIEHWIDTVERGTSDRTLGEVARRLLGDWSDSKLEADTVDGRRSLIRKWICSPVPRKGHDDEEYLLAEVTVDGWDEDLSRDFLQAVADTDEIGSARLEDLRTLLAAIRDKAHDLRWLPRDEDPLRRVKAPKVVRGTPQQNSRRGYVPEGMRPQTAAVETLVALATDAAQSSDRAIDPLQLRIGAYMGARLSEQLGVAAEDLDITVNASGEADGMELILSGAWISPRGKDPHYRPWTKNKTWRPVPVPGSMVQAMLRAAAHALGLPADTPATDIVKAIAARRQAFAEWYDLRGHADVVAMPTRHYLFLDPETDVPWEQERFNELFRSLRKATAELAETDANATAWPSHIPYRNARHHAAMWWRQTIPEAKDEEWTLIAKLLGNSPETCRKQYVVLGDGAYESARERIRLM